MPSPRSLPSLPVALLLGPKTCVIDVFERLLQPRREVAGIEHHGRFDRHQPSVVRHLIGQYQVLHAKLGRIHADLASRDIEQPLARVSGLGAAGTAVGRGWALVGEHAHHLALVILDPVGARYAGHRQRRIDRAERAEVGALIAEQPAAHAADRSVRLQRNREVDIHLSGMNDREHVLAPIFDPFHRSADAQHGKRNQHVLWVKLDLYPKAPADFRLDDTDTLLVQTEQCGGQGALGVRPLPGGPNGELPVHRVLRRERAARFYRHAGIALHPERLADHVGGAVEGLRHVADPLRPADGDIVGHGVVQHRRARGHRAFHARHGRQRFVVDLGKLQSILGEIAALRDDHGNRLTHIAHLVAGQQVLRARLQRLHRSQDGYGRRLVGPDVGQTESVHHPGGLACRRKIDTANTGIAVGAAKESRMQRVGKLYVVDETGLSGEEAGILEALDALADHCCAHVNAPIDGLPSRPP